MLTQNRKDNADNTINNEFITLEINLRRRHSYWLNSASLYHFLRANTTNALMQFYVSLCINMDFFLLCLRDSEMPFQRTSGANSAHLNKNSNSGGRSSPTEAELN